MYHLRNFILHILIFTFCSVVYRFIFFFQNIEIFQLTASEIVKSIIFGLRFDFAIASIISLALVLLNLSIKSKKINLFFTLLISIPYAFYFAADLFYFKNARKHITYEINESVDNMVELFHEMLNNFHYYVIYALLPVLIYLLLYRHLFQDYRSTSSKNIVAGFLLSLTLVIFARGGFQDMPMEPETVYLLNKHEKVLFATNPTYVAFFSLVVANLTSDEYSKMQIRKVPTKKREHHDESLKRLEPASYDSLNLTIKSDLVIVLLESWSEDILLDIDSSYKKTKKLGLHTSHMLAPGARTSEGLFSILCSYPKPVRGGLTRTKMIYYDYLCLSQVVPFDESGYITGSFHEAGGVSHLASKLGIQNLYGKVENPSAAQKIFGGFMTKKSIPIPSV